jgi:hypothetical protein
MEKGKEKNFLSSFFMWWKLCYPSSVYFLNKNVLNVCALTQTFCICNLTPSCISLDPRAVPQELTMKLIIVMHKKNMGRNPPIFFCSEHRMSPYTMHPSLSQVRWLTTGWTTGDRIRTGIIISLFAPASRSATGTYSPPPPPNPNKYSNTRG